MRKFKITVDGREFAVTVEEIHKNTAAPVVGEKKEEPHPAAPVTTGEITAMPVPVPSDGSPIPSPMPGLIIDVPVKVGDTVAAGDVIVILEAMKMENEVTAPVGGTVTRVAVRQGDSVSSGDLLVMIG